MCSLARFCSLRSSRLRFCCCRRHIRGYIFFRLHRSHHTGLNPSSVRSQENRYYICSSQCRRGNRWGRTSISSAECRSRIPHCSRWQCWCRPFCLAGIPFHRECILSCICKFHSRTGSWVGGHIYRRNSHIGLLLPCTHTDSRQLRSRAGRGRDSLIGPNRRWG